MITDAERKKELEKIVKKNRELIIEFMENCQKILDNPDKYGEFAVYRSSALILCFDSLMNIMSSPYKDKIEEAREKLFAIHQSMLLENKEYQIKDFIKNPHFISTTSKTIQ